MFETARDRICLALTQAGEIDGHEMKGTFTGIKPVPQTEARRPEELG